MIQELVIINVLREAGQKGMPLRRIALNVFNLTNSLFEPLDKEVVYENVGQYLRKNASLKGGIIERAETKGWYRINYNSQHVQQLLLEFATDEEEFL